MRQEYLLRLFCTDEKTHEFSFKCTKRQIDKVFYSLAFASVSSTIRCARLYCVIRKPSGLVSSLLSVNTFNVKDNFYNLAHLEQYRNV